MATLNSIIKQLQREVEKLTSKIQVLEKALSEAQTNKPYSKVYKQPKFENMDLVYHEDFWKTYAVYKDEEEEEEAE